MAKTTFATRTLAKFLYDGKSHLFYRYKYHLSDALTGLDFIGLLTAVPAGNEYLALVIRIDQSGQIAQDQSVFVAKTGTRQQHGRQRIVADVDCQSCRDQHSFAGVHR